MNTPLVEVEDLRVSFGGNVAVDGVSLQVAAGECLALVGESGSGKTVTSRALLGLVPEAGEVSSSVLAVQGRDMRHGSQREWQGVRGHAVGLVTQDALVSLDPLRTIGAEVGEVLRTRGATRSWSREERREAVVQELDHVAVPEPGRRIRQYPHELSGGLRQRALIASATIARPPLLIADEPTTALDLRVQAQVLDLLEQLRAAGTGLLLISHDLAVVARIADRVAVMRNGRIVETGTTQEVLTRPRHEYTIQLLKATPGVHNRGQRLSDVPPLEFPAPSQVPDRTNVVLEVRDVAKNFRLPDGGTIQAVKGATFELRAGQSLGLVGESGSGKTTLGRILLGLEVPDRGEVLLEGEPWSALPEKRRRHRRGALQVVFQDPLSSFDPRYTVARILGEALELEGLARAARRNRASELLEQVGLDPVLLERRPLTLSGGQRQRIAIARALARNPRVLVCDEPVSALDVSVQAQVLDVFSDIRDQLGLAMLFISHDLSVVHHMCDDVLVMSDGDIVERGSADQVFLDPQHDYTAALVSALPQPAHAAGGNHDH